MIEKYFNGVIEQVYHRIGTAEKNIVMASYNNDFSVSVENKNVIRKTITFFACCELQYETLSGAYTPFLDIICDMFRKFVKEILKLFCANAELMNCTGLCFWGTMKMVSAKGKKGCC